MKRKITAAVKEIREAKKIAREAQAQKQQKLHPLEMKSSEDLVRLNTQLSTYLLNLPNGAKDLTDKDKDEWKMVRSILKKRGVHVPTKVVARTYSKEVFLLVTRI